MKWLLLIATIFAALLTRDAYRWKGGVKTVPFDAIEKLWGRDGLGHLSERERMNLRERMSSYRLGGIGLFIIFFGTFTVALAIATVKAFLE